MLCWRLKWFLVRVGVGKGGGRNWEGWGGACWWGWKWSNFFVVKKMICWQTHKPSHFDPSRHLKPPFSLTSSQSTPKSNNTTATSTRIVIWPANQLQISTIHNNQLHNPTTTPPNPHITNKTQNGQPLLIPFRFPLGPIPLQDQYGRFRRGGEDFDLI